MTGGERSRQLKQPQTSVGAGSQRRAKPERGRNVGFEVPQLLLAAVRIRGFAAVFRSGCAREGADEVQTEQWRPLRSAAPLSQGPTVIKNERFTDLLPKPTTSKKVSPLHGIYAEQYHPCTPPTRRKGRKSWGLGGRETLALLRGRRFGCPNSPEAREIKHTLKYDRLKLPSAFFTDKNG